MTDNTDEPQGRDASDRTEPDGVANAIARLQRAHAISVDANDRVAARVLTIGVTDTIKILTGAGQDVAALRAEREEAMRRMGCTGGMPLLDVIDGTNNDRRLLHENNAALREQLATERDHHERTAAQLATVTRERAQDIDNAVKPGLREVARLEAELDTLHKRIAAAEVLADRWERRTPSSEAASGSDQLWGERSALRECARELRAALTQDDRTKEGR
jgi:hypothetical protein